MHSLVSFPINCLLVVSASLFSLSIFAQDPLFKLLGEETGVDFSNTVVEDELNNSFRYEYFYNGAGVAVGDLNNDGLPDLYFTGNSTPDKVYLNKGNLQFEDITAVAIPTGNEGWHTGVTMVDINSDGFLDVYVCRGGDRKIYPDATNLLYINNRDNTFTESAKKYGLADPLNSTQAAFFDFDRDGDLDVFVMNVPDGLFTLTGQQYRELFESGNNKSDHFYRNDNGVFTDISKSVGIDNHSFGLGLAIGDLDNNGWPDIYVANDYEDGDYMFMNTNGQFREELKIRTKHISNFGMGVDIADFNNDGHLDIVELDMAFPSHERSKRNMASMSNEKFWSMVKRGNHFQYMVNTLQLNNGNGTFSEIGQLAGVSKTDWSWSALFADFDNDGLKDLFVTNGQDRDLKDRDFQIELQRQIDVKKKLSMDDVFRIAPQSKQHNYIFKNNDSFSFSDYSKQWGLDRAVNSNGAAYADLDNDGDLDLVINNFNERASIYENTLNGAKNFLRIALVDSKGNTPMLGARITLFTDQGEQVQEFFPSRGYLSSVDPILHFGLGDATKVARLEVRWPNGNTSIVKEVEINKQMIIDFQLSGKTPLTQKVFGPFFTDASRARPIPFEHTENEFNDFNRELLLPHALSKMGPVFRAGDVNGDGKEDIFAGAAKGSVSKLFLQQEQGKFTPAPTNPFYLDSMCEDVGAHFFDADSDGDLDLYVASGGNDYSKNDPFLQDRLYLNDGTGAYTKSADLIPIMITSTRIVQSADFDQDGDLDLFVGGRVVPGQYPTAPRSYLLQNDGGIFTDVTSEYSAELTHPGMINGAEFIDVNQDGKIDLILIGEWTGLMVFINNGKSFDLQPVDPNTEGLWFSLKAADIDGDGDLDLIAGNLGKNTKFKTTNDKPLSVYGNDFDQNGTFDIVLGGYSGDEQVPVRGRECSSQQMPFITEVCPTYRDFAESSLSDLYGTELESGVHLTARNLASSIFVNNGNGQFEMTPLPAMAQFSPINEMVVEDLNGDGDLDLLGVGNLYEAEVETVRYDAGRGICLIGNGKGQFDALTPEESGFFAWNNSKSLITFMVAGTHVYLVGVNGMYPQVYIKP